MNINDKYLASEEDFEKLFNLAIEYKKLEPWKDFADRDFIKIHKKKNYFLSVLGNSGLSCGLQISIGKKGLFGANLMLNEDLLSINTNDIIFRQDSIHLYIDDESDFTPELLNYIKEMIHVKMYENKYLYFKRLINGSFPSELTKDEVLETIEILSLFIEFYKEYKSTNYTYDKDKYIITYHKRRNAEKYEIMLDDANKYALSFDYLSYENNEDLLKFKRSKIELEFDANFIDVPFKDKIGRDCNPLFVTAVNCKTGAVEGVNVFNNKGNENEFIMDTLLDTIYNLKKLPMVIYVRSNLMHEYLIDELMELDIDIEVVDSLIYTEEVIDQLLTDINSNTIEGVF